MEQVRVCVECGNEFTARSTHQKYCSILCKKKAYNHSLKGRETGRKWREKNKEKINEYKRNYYWKNREEELLANKKNYEKHKEKRLNSNKEYVKKNKKQIKQYQNEYYKENSGKLIERSRKWRKENPLLVKAQRQTPNFKFHLRKVQARRKRDLGYFELFKSPFPKNVMVDYHHINDLVVVPLPKSTHAETSGPDIERHRKLANPMVEKLYSLDLKALFSL